MRGYFNAVDGVRLGSALSVALFHLGFYSWFNPSSTVGHAFNGAARFDALAPLTWWGWVGVETFFVISGLVIANSANGTTPIAFAKSRILRLYPAVWICAPLTFLALAFFVHDASLTLLAPLARSLLLSPAGSWIDGVYWSLAVELSFYLLIFLVLVRRDFSQLPVIAWVLTCWGGLYLTGMTLHELGLLPGYKLWRALAAYDDVLLLRFGTFFALGIWLWLGSQGLMTRARWLGAAACLFAGSLEIIDRCHEMVEGVHPYLALVPISIWFGCVLLIFLSTHFPETFTPRSERVRLGLKRAGVNQRRTLTPYRRPILTPRRGPVPAAQDRSCGAERNSEGLERAARLSSGS